MKAILVIDIPKIPKNCMSCPLIEYHREYSIVCRHYQTGDTRPSWCPLKPMPERKDTSNRKITYEELRERIGWNECVEEIEK